MRKEERWRVAAEKRIEMGGWFKERMKYEGFIRSILKICIM